MSSTQSLGQKVIDRNRILPMSLRDKVTGEEVIAKFSLENSYWTYKIEQYQVDVGPFESLLDAIETARQDLSVLSLDKFSDQEEQQSPNIENNNNNNVNFSTN